MIKLTSKRIGLIVAGMAIVFWGRWGFYNTGFYEAPRIDMPKYDQIVTLIPPSTEYSDTFAQTEGTILIDMAHDNAFNLEELSVLTARLVSRGLDIDFYNPEEDLEGILLGADIDQGEKTSDEMPIEGDGQEEETNSGEAEGTEGEELNVVIKAFIIVAPQVEFSDGEIDSINEYIENEGKLFLLADPTRPSKINTLSLGLGILFESDYLYNMKENDANYRNIFITRFKENAITKGLQRIALYTAGSISSADEGIAFTDDNTSSSLIETRKNLSPLVLSYESKVLAIHDLTFMTEPYNGVLDNNQLISNVADWLAGD